MPPEAADAMKQAEEAKAAAKSAETAVPVVK
jgi:hypothetical protein